METKLLTPDDEKIKHRLSRPRFRVKKNEEPKKNRINMFPCSRCKRDPLFEVLIYNPKAGIEDRIYLCKKHLIKEGIPDKLLIFAGVIKKCQ